MKVQLDEIREDVAMTKCNLLEANFLKIVSHVKMRIPKKDTTLLGARLSEGDQTRLLGFGSRSLWSAQRSFAKLCGRSRVPKPLRRDGRRDRREARKERTAAGVTPRRWRRTRWSGRRAEAGPQQLQRKVRPCVVAVLFLLCSRNNQRTIAPFQPFAPLRHETVTTRERIGFFDRKLVDLLCQAGLIDIFVRAICSNLTDEL